MMATKSMEELMMKFGDRVRDWMADAVMSVGSSAAVLDASAADVSY